MEDDILQNFLDDTREHLADIETDLLDIEAAGADFDSEMVNKVFRTAHSIKGSAGFLGLTKISELSHKIENILDMIRSRKLVPTPDVVNVVLGGFDKLKEMVDNIGESENADISKHVEMLVALTSDGSQKQEVAVVSGDTGFTLADGSPVFSPSAEALAEAARGGNFIYIVKYDLMTDVQAKGQTPMEFIEFLRSSGTLLDICIDTGSVGGLSDPEPAGLNMFVLYSTILEPDMVNMVLKAGAGSVQDITPAESPEASGGAAQVSGPPGLKPGADKDLDEMSRQFDAAVGGGEAGGDDFADDILVESVAGFELIKEGTKVILRLDGNLTIDRAGAVKEALQRSLEVGGEELEIDISELESADLCLLQLIMAVARTGHGINGLKTHVASAPEAFSSRLDQAGLTELGQAQGLVPAS